VVINNNKLREVYGNLGFKAGFSKADEVLSTASRGIAEVITHHYTQNIDLKDAKTVLSNSGTAIMGSATASGKNRSEDAISKALDSPLLNDNKITGAKNVLLLIVSGKEEITIDEIGEINDFIQEEAKSDVNIIMGIGEDESLGDAISVTIVATGFNKDQQHEISNTEPKKVIHVLDDEQKSSFDLSDKRNTLSPMSQSTEKPLKVEPVKEDKIVFDLGEDEEDEDEFKIIPTSELIKNIEVTYEEISAVSENDFVITELVVDEVEEPAEEPVVEIKQTSFSFDFPISSSKEVVEDKKTKEPINEIEVVEPKVVKPEPIKKVEEDVYFTLEDYTEIEETFAKATKPSAPANKPVAKKVEESEMDIKIRSIEEIDINNHEVIEHKEVSPLDLTISELQKRADDRRKKMKEFNYRFSHKVASNIDEIEKEPAYKRRGIQLNETSHSSEITTSRTTLEIDENDGIQLRSNNSYLHDNVD
jgi:cell division protein FtsZ